MPAWTEHDENGAGPAEPLEAERLRTSGADPERAAASAELRPVLAAAIAALPESQREVFLLREMAGVPFHGDRPHDRSPRAHGEEPDALRTGGPARRG